MAAAGDALTIDRNYLTDTLVRLARVPTDVPLGYETLMEPDDPKLVHYVQQVIRPELVRLGIYDLIDVGNNLLVRAGEGRSGKSLLLMNYTPAQHHNLMDDPFSGAVANAGAYGCDEPAVFGQGVSQCKAHQAVMLAVLRALEERGAPLRGRLWWALNNEGRSSHACSDALLDAIAARESLPQFGIIQIDSGGAITLGNRGRVDVDVHIRGKVAHSSSPQEGLNVIEAVADVVHRVRRLTWPDTHPLLGGRHAVVYKVRYKPVAPHTLPSDAWLAIDRRLLPGDDLAAAVDEVRSAIGDLSPFEVTVRQGVAMLPALVAEADPGVLALVAAHERIVGEQPQRVYLGGSFDAGGPCARGVPTVMYGVGGGVGLTGVDFVPIARVETEARVLADVIVRELG